MALQLHHPILKVPPTPPTQHIQRKVLVVPPRILFSNRILRHVDEEIGGERQVVVPLLQTLAVEIPAQHVDMQMVHGRIGVGAGDDLFVPISAGRKLVGQVVGFHGFSSDLLCGGGLSKLAAQLADGDFSYFLLLRDAVGEECWVVESFLWSQDVLPSISGQYEEMYCRLGEEVVDYDKFLVVVDNTR